MEVDELVSHLDIEGVDLSSLDGLSVKESERLGRFTASEDYKLMTGIDYTQEQRINAVKNQFKKKAELEEYAKSLGIQVDGKATMLDIAALIEPMVKDTLTEGAITHVRNKVIEELTGRPIMDFESYDMQRGKEIEGPTVDWMKKKYGYEITKCLQDQVFVTDCENEKLKGHIGCTPDGYIKAINCGFEGKAPKRETHFKYLFGDGDKQAMSKESLKDLEPSYYWQIVKCLYMNPSWDGYVWTSYNPEFKDEKLRDITFVITRQQVQEDIPKLENRLEMAVDKKIEILNQIRNGI